MFKKLGLCLQYNFLHVLVL